MTLELTDGSKVNAAEYAFASEEEALIYESVLHMGVNAATANALVQQFRHGKVSAETYVRGIAEAYTYGLYGLAESEMSPVTFTADLSAEQRRTAYRLGKTDAKAAVEAEQARINNLKRAVAQAKSTGEVYNEDGTVLEESDALTKLQKASIRALKALAKALKLDFYVYESYEREVDETGAPVNADVKESSRGIAKRSKASYNEFASLAMRWANKADRQSGDATIIYDAKRKRHVMIEALESGYFEVASGTYEEMRAEYERVYPEQDTSIHEDLDQARAEQRSSVWDLQLSEDRGYDVGDAGSFRSEGFQADTAGNDEHLRGRHQGESAKYSDRQVERVYKTPDGTIKKAPNGFFVDADNRIHVDLNAGLDGKGTMLYTVSHELGHFIKKWSPKKFKALADFLAKTYGKHGKSVVDLVEEQQKKAERNGREISFDEAYEEFVCDSLTRMLTDGDAAAKIEALQQHDASIVAKIKEFFADLATKLKAVRNAYKGIEPDSVEGRFINESLAEFDRLQQLFAEGLVDAADAYNSTDQTKNTAEDGGVKYQIRDAFYSQLDNWDKATTGFSFVLGTTSPALQEAGIPDKQIRLDATKAKTLLEKHNGMTVDVIRQLPELLENPVVVIDSKQNKDAKIVMGDLTDKNGKVVTVVLLLTPTSKKGNQLDVIKVSSAEGRGHIESLFKNTDGTSVPIRFVDKKRIQSWLNANRLQLPLHSFNSDSNNSISNSAENVKENSPATAGAVKYSIKNTSSMSIQEQLKKYRNGEMASSDAFYFGETPTSIGESGLQAIPLVFTQSDYKKSHSTKHSVPFRLMKSLNSLLENSLFSFDADGRYGFVTEEIDADGKPLLIAVEANVQMDRKPVNAIRSVYGLDDPTVWIKNQVEVGKHLVSYNKEGTNKFLQTYGYSASVEGTVESLRDRIPQSSENVKAKLSDRDAIDKSFRQGDNIDRAAREGELVNDYYHALSKSEWRSFYNQLKDEGFLGKTKVGTIAYVVIGDKLVIAERVHQRRDSHDYQVVDAYQVTGNLGSWGKTAILNELANIIEEEGNVYDKRRISRRFVRHVASIDEESVLRRFDTNDSRYVDCLPEGEKGRSGTEIHGDSEARTAGSGLSLRDQSSRQRDNGLQKFSDRDYAELERRRQVDRALRAENERLQEDVGRLREMLSAQDVPTNGRRFSKTAVDAAATQLMQRAGARFRGDKAGLASMLNAFYDDVASDEDLRWETVAEKAQPIVEWIQAHRPIDTLEQDHYRELTARELLADVYDGFWNVTTLHTVAAEIDLLKGKHKQQMKALRERRDAKIKELQAEYRERIKRIREQKNAAIDREITRTRETYRHTLEKRKEATAAREARTKLQKLVLETVRWLAHPAKTDVKCPDILREPYAEFLNSIDLTSKRQLGGGEATHNDLRLKSAMDTLANAIDAVRVAQAPGTDAENILDAGYLDLPAYFVAELRAIADGIKADMTADKRGRPASTAQAIEAHEEVIDLSADNELSKEVEGVFGSAKYKIIQRYILRLLGNQPVTMSDGVQAVVDKSDALHIAHGAADKKTAQVAEIKNILSRAVPFAEDSHVEHTKFDYFRYYRVRVRYGAETFDCYVNVGRGKSDGQYHLYDITKKIRDTADRINGLERPKPNEGYAYKNGISMDSISDSDGNVKTSTIRKNMETLAAMSPVYRVPAEKLQKSGKRPSDLFREFFESVGNRVVSPEFGEIELSNSSVKSETRHGITSEKLAAIEAIPEVLRTGKVIFDETKSGTDVRRVVVAAPITIGGENYYMGAMLQMDNNTQRLYLHNVVVEKEMPIPMDADSLTELGSHQNEHLNEESFVANEGNLLTDRDLRQNEPLFISSILQKAVNVKFEHLRNTGDRYTVNEMKAEDIRKISKLIRQLNHAIKEMGRIYANGRFANVQALGADSMTFMDELGELEKTSAAGDYFGWDNALPFYAFKRFGKGGESVFEEFE